MLPFILTIADETEQSYLESLYNSYSGRMYNSAYKILESKQDAEDALQDTFIKIYNNINTFVSLSGDDLVLLIIIYTRNTARDILRKRKVRQKHTAEKIYDDNGEELYSDIEDTSENVEEIVIRNETIRETRDYIDSLPEPQRDVIIMKYRLGMKEKEIASALGISETAVSSRILRAKDGLRRLISKKTV